MIYILTEHSSLFVCCIGKKPVDYANMDLYGHINSLFENAVQEFASQLSSRFDLDKDILMDIWKSVSLSSTTKKTSIVTNSGVELNTVTETEQTSINPRSEKTKNNKTNKIEKTKNNKTNKNDTTSKRKLSPYIQYCKLIRGDVTSEFPNEKPTQITRIIAQRWKALSDKEKAEYARSTTEPAVRSDTEHSEAQEHPEHSEAREYLVQEDVVPRVLTATTVTGRMLPTLDMSTSKMVATENVDTEVQEEEEDDEAMEVDRRFSLRKRMSMSNIHTEEEDDEEDDDCSSLSDYEMPVQQTSNGRHEVENDYFFPNHDTLFEDEEGQPPRANFDVITSQQEKKMDKNISFKKMKRGELEEYCKNQKIDISQCKSKIQIVELLSKREELAVS